MDINKDNEVVTPESEDKTVSEFINEMPELHDELDKITKMRERSSHRKTRIIVSVIIVALCLLCVWLGMNYFSKRNSESVDNQIAASTGVLGDTREVFFENLFTPEELIDASTAESTLNNSLAALSITDINTRYSLKNEFTVGKNKYYRFTQVVGGIKVYGGEIVLANLSGKSTVLSGRIIDTDGLSTKAELDSGSASNAISGYISKLQEEYRIASGANVIPAEKTVCNDGETTYLAYVSNVSGYNEKGEYVAFDVFVDANNGNGIFILNTSSYENPDETPVAPNETPVYKTNDSGVPMSIFTVNDKFNWNDETKTASIEEINKEDLSSGMVSPYVLSTKSAVENAYSYFANSLAYRGLDGKGGKFKVYINANEYLNDKLPPISALYTRNILMFHREDLTSGALSLSTAAHEYAHGVMYNIASLDGTRDLTENSAVAEGLADVFGELSEIYSKGSADWILGPNPENSSYLEHMNGKPVINNINDVYRYSTIVSIANLRMFEHEISAELLGELNFNVLCLMTKGADLSRWRALTEFSAKVMTDEGKLTGEQFDIICSILNNTGVSSKSLYIQSSASMEQEIPSGETPIADGLNEKIIE